MFAQIPTEFAASIGKRDRLIEIFCFIAAGPHSSYQFVGLRWSEAASSQAFRRIVRFFSSDLRSLFSCVLVLRAAADCLLAPSALSPTAMAWRRLFVAVRAKCPAAA